MKAVGRVRVRGLRLIPQQLQCRLAAWRKGVGQKWKALRSFGEEPREWGVGSAGE